MAVHPPSCSSSASWGHDHWQALDNTRDAHVALQHMTSCVTWALAHAATFLLVTKYISFRVRFSCYLSVTNLAPAAQVKIDQPTNQSGSIRQTNNQSVN